MQPNQFSNPSIIVILRWIARIVSACLFFFWGAFFIEHLSWFGNPHELPPLWVFGMQGLHFLMLIGFIVGWKWEWAGGLLILICSVPFFYIAAGSRAWLFIAMNAVPAVLWLICWRSQFAHRALPS